MERLKLSGFPEVSEQVELPNMAQLLTMPWYQYASIDDVYNHGGEIYRNLLSKIPLKNKNKYVLVTSRVQYLTKEGLSIRFLNNWHTDSSLNPFKVNEPIHLLLSECTALTEFNENPVETDPLDVNIGQFVLNDYIQNNAERLGLKARTVEPNRFVTFDSTYAHRAVTPKEDELRFMLRVIESDDFTPPPLERAITNMSFTFTDNVEGREHLVAGKMSNGYQLKNIHQMQNGFMIYK